MRVVLAGGSGYIGSALARALADDGADVVILSRGSAPAPGDGIRIVHWDPGHASVHWSSDLRRATAVVNLAGANIGNRPWTPGRRREILDSRLRVTGALVQAIQELDAEERPGALINASGADAYGERGDEILSESSLPSDNAFLAEVCARWEEAAQAAEPLGVRVALIRTGLVLSRRSAALRLMALPFRLFVGGRTGSGRQWISWIHLRDIVGLYQLAITDQAITGPLNGVSPEPVRNADFAAEIGRVLHRPNWLPAPAPLLRLALQKQSEVLLVGHRVLPPKALAHGYQFAFPTLAPALADALA